jgi:hypothetical protein
MAHVIHYFNSVSDFTAKALTGTGNKRSSRSENRHHAWDLGVGFDGAVKLAYEGWPEGTAKVQALQKKISAPIIQALERQVEFSIEPGEWIDPDRLLQGEAEVWGSVQETEVESKGARGRSAHFLVGVTTSGGIEADIILRRGSAIVASIDILESLGFRIKVTAYDSCYGEGSSSKDAHVDIVQLKDYHEPINLDAVSFALTHPGFARRIGFGAQDAQSEEIRKRFGFHSGSGYGHPEFNFIPDEVVYNDQQVIKFDGMVLSQFKDEAGAVKSVIDTLKQFGIELDLGGK